MPLAKLIPDTAQAVVEALGLEQKDELVEGLATRWQRETLVMQPVDNQFTRRGGLQSKQFTRPGRRGDRGGFEIFFHKIVMIPKHHKTLARTDRARNLRDFFNEPNGEPSYHHCRFSRSFFASLREPNGEPLCHPCWLSLRFSAEKREYCFGGSTRSGADIS